MDNRHHRFVEFYFGEPPEWCMPGDLLYMILEFSGLVRIGRRSSFFVIYEPRLSRKDS